MYDVAIVGAGPTGSVAAAFCGAYGLRTLVLDRATDVYDLPRAAGIWDDVQRILESAGLLDAVLPATCEHVGAEFVDAAGRRIIGIDLPPGLRTSNGHPPIRGVSQPCFERAIRRRLATRDGVELRLGHEVLEIAQAADGVSCTVRSRATGDAATVRARWLVGCDGARSLVRESCGIGWKSLGYDCDWLVVDVRLTRDVPLPRCMQQVCDPARPTTVIPMPQRHHRWEFQLLPGETRDAMEDRRRVWSLLAPWISPGDAEIVRAVVYRFHATIADRFRHGRVFLAGDAAHQTPPFLGQGMCSGIRDAENLVWKLEHVTHARAADALLDSYDTERRPMAVAMVEHSVKTGKLVDAWAAAARGGPEPPAELREHAYGGRARLPDLSTGLLSDEDAPWIGRLVPNGPVPGPSGTAPLDDVVGLAWAIVSTGDARAGMTDAVRAVWERLGAVPVTVPEPEGALRACLDAQPTAVVRPDRVISAASPDAAAALLAGLA